MNLEIYFQIISLKEKIFTIFFFGVRMFFHVCGDLYLFYFPSVTVDKYSTYLKRILGYRVWRK